MVSFNPACYVPNVVSNVLPLAIACPPPPSRVYTIYDTLVSPFSATFTVLRSGMDAIASLPLLSALMIPTVTSYSTSLNLLFFYLTWSTLVLSHSPLRVEIVACLAIRVLFYIIPSLLFLTFDILVPGFSESFKNLGAQAIPLRNLDRQNTLRQAKLIGWSFANILIAVTVQAATEYVLVEVLHKQSALKVTTTLPLPWAIVKDVLRGLLLRDTFTYIIHRFLLHSSHKRQELFSTLTRQHVGWYHTEVRCPFPLSPTYDHPFIHLLRSFIPTYLPAYLWRFHLLTYMVYLIAVSLEDTFTHSGYATLPTNFVLGGIARRNEVHCLANGEGNFGTWGLMDWICGTGVGGDVVEELLDEVDRQIEEEKLQERLVRSARRGVGKLTSSGGRKKEKKGIELQQQKQQQQEHQKQQQQQREDEEESGYGTGITNLKAAIPARSRSRTRVRARTSTPRVVTARPRRSRRTRSGSDDDYEDNE